MRADATAADDPHGDVVRLAAEQGVGGVAIREWMTAPVYVCYGGAKFWIPDPETLVTLGLDNSVRLIPPGGAALVGDLPADDTLLRELHDPKVFLVRNGMLSWVTSPEAMAANCLAWRNVRVVPDGALATLQQGPPIG